MAAKTTEAATVTEEKSLGEATSTADQHAAMTNVRHVAATQKLIEELKALAEDDTNRGFEIGDRVQVATAKHKLRVADLVKAVGLSRQRLCDCRTTAVAFRGKSRRQDVPFHFFTLAARAAKQFNIEAEKALEMVTQQGLQSTREASACFARKRREHENGQALEKAGLLVAQHDDLLDSCHHEDFRDVVARLDAGSVNLVIADPSYDGKRKTTTSATKRNIDGDNPADAQAAIEDLLKLFADKMAKGGVLALFRPGAALDPAWLSAAIESSDWACAWALTWNKRKAKLGRTDAPYGIATERLLILSRRGEKLIGHDDSSRDDVLDVKAVQPHYSDSDPLHQHEKPLDLMRHLIGKHTYEGELVVEPFGGSGPASQAAVELNRHWLYCETAQENLNMATARIATAQEERTRAAG